MDRSREVKREENRHSSLVAKLRQSKASGHELLSVWNVEDGEFLEISKKEMAMGSSKDEEMMMGLGSEGEEEFRLRGSCSSRRRFKTNEKAFGGRNTVGPAAVPRRLRSAMNKRKHESVSLPLTDERKNKHHLTVTETDSINGIKKSRIHMNKGSSDGSLKRVVTSAITKDEEEVAEALFSLASMVNEPAKSKVDEAAKAAVAFPLPETHVSSPSPSVASEEEITKSPNNFVRAQVFSPKESSAVTVNVEPANESTVLEQPTYFEGRKIQLELNDTAQDDLRGIALLSKNKQEACTHLKEAVKSITPMEIPSISCPQNGLQVTIKPEAVSMRKQEISTLPGISVTAQQEAKSIKENVGSCAHIQENAPDLQPVMPKGLSSGHWSLTQISSNKAGTWPDSTAWASIPSSTGNYVSKEKIALVSVGRRQSMKRCALHVYISRLIHVYQNMEKKSGCQPSTDQVKLKGVELGITTPSNQTLVKTGVSNVKPLTAHGSVADRNLHEARIQTLREKGVLHDQQASTSTYHPHQKQARRASIALAACCESNGNSGNALESSSAQRKAPYLHPLVRYPVVPFSFQHARCSSPYPDQVGAAGEQHWYHQVQTQQLSQYSGNPFPGPQLLCTSQMIHNTPGYSLAPHAPKWQNGRRHEVPSLVHGILVPSPSSLEVLGPRNMPNAQRFLPVSSSSLSSPTRGGKRQHHNHRSSNFDEEGGGAGFHSDGVPPHLQQLLCNAQNM